MSAWVKKLISAIIAGLITGITSLVAVAQELSPDAALADIGGMTLTVIIGGALLTMFKDVQAYLSAPPQD